MKITIMSHQEALTVLETNPNSINVIFISSPSPDTYRIKNSDKIEGLAKLCCTLLFNDTNTESKQSSPKKEDVQKALKFAKSKDSVLVTCQAGISRSAAIAYLIAVQDQDAISAFNVLDRKLHRPNKLVVKHGTSILDKSNLVELMEQWLD